MYFGIIGDHEELAQYALHYLHTTDFTIVKKNLIIFDTPYPERIATCASIIKRGEIFSKEEMKDKIISDTVGVADKALGAQLKKKIEVIKRFKLVELIHTDIEIKDSGQEIIALGEEQYGLVEGYQNIRLYETIDFEKPVGGMGVGMMPSKLALTLINIGVGEYEKKSNTSLNDLTIRDPFCGFGTTNFLANTLGYNTIGSDLNPTQAKQNTKRWSDQSFCTANKKITLLKHDVTEPFKSPIFHYGNIIVSEGRLGHIVTHKTAHNEVELFSNDVAIVYKKFFDNLTAFYKQSPTQDTKTIIITIPTWLKHNISISESIRDHANSLGRTTNLLEKPYSREKQLIGRQVLIGNYGK